MRSSDDVVSAVNTMGLIVGNFGENAHILGDCEERGAKVGVATSQSRTQGSQACQPRVSSLLGSDRGQKIGVHRDWQGSANRGQQIGFSK